MGNRGFALGILLFAAIIFVLIGNVVGFKTLKEVLLEPVLDFVADARRALNLK